MTTNDQWMWWRNALEGNFIEDQIQRGNPQSGFYRDRNKRAVAIWRDEATGELLCSVTSGYAPKHADEVDELFGFVCRSPISDELYTHIANGGGWPEDVPDVAPQPERGIGDNSAAIAPHESIADEINRLVDSARDWLASVGGKITEKLHADKAANYAERFGALEKKADAARVEEKRPFDESAKAVQEKWRPIVALADEKKRYMKKAIEGFLIAEKRRLEAEAKAAAIEAAKEAEIAAEQYGEVAPPPPPLAAVRVNAGTRGKTALKTRDDFVVTDIAVFAGFLIGMETPPPTLIEALEKIARQMGHSGTIAPGVERRTIEYAA